MNMKRRLALLVLSVAAANPPSVGGVFALRVNPGVGRAPPGRRLEDAADDGAAVVDDDAAAEEDAAADDDGGAADDGAASEDYDDYAVGRDDDGEGADWDDGDDAASAYDDAWREAEVAAEDSNSTAVEGFVSRIKDYGRSAETAAWTFYERPPSEWTGGQWDLAFGLLFAAFATCCLGSAWCAWCCMGGARDEIEREPLSPKAAGTVTVKDPPPGPGPPPSPSRKRSGASHRKEFTEDHYRRYQEEREDGGETESLTTDGGSAYRPPETPSSLGDYTAAQREREMATLDAWRGGGEDEEEEDRTSTIVNPGNSPLARYADAQRKREDSWNEHWSRSVPKSVGELDSAMARSGGAGDKLLEARDHQHNLVGYYL